MTTITPTRDYVAGDTLTDVFYDADRAEVRDVVNGNIDNNNIVAGAAIAYSKLNLTGNILNADLAGSIAKEKISNTAVTLSDTQTLTSKTLTSPTITGGTLTTSVITGSYDAWVTDTDGATVTFNLASGNKHRVTLGGSRTLALSGVQNGHVFIIALIQDGGGSRTVGWFGGISWAGGSAPTLTTTGGKADLFGFIQTGSNTYYGLVLGSNI